MRAAANFIPDGFAPKAFAYMKHKKRLQVGPFSIVPYLVDMNHVARITMRPSVKIHPCLGEPSTADCSTLGKRKQTAFS
jgi:hypothetical protein